MGFADLLIAKIAADYSEAVAKELSVCNQLGIAYKNQKTVWRWRMQRQLFPNFCLKHAQTVLTAGD
ncbi:hypothetical protein [Fischerella sp. PCC 9605]|uniref:hypothetical protein n=1 Tax=Fischerella sp. PCC 9605 TaxID=1173024 RepID=UPI0004AEF0FC|nr:hypothetical protein [Fischerella sp. PCC 9605]